MDQSSFAHVRPVIALLTDFGAGDGDVGVMKGVIAGICPEAHCIDITHEIAPQRVLSGAWILGTAYRYFPRHTVFVCVVDPGVGSGRGAMAMQAGDWFFVGPDNGLFSYILAEQTVHGAVRLTNPRYQLPHVSATFHGRDIFAPAGAHLAKGVSLDTFGPELVPTTLQRLSIQQATRYGAKIDGHIIHVDHFGNLISDIPMSMVPELLQESVALRVIFPEQGAIVEERGAFFAAGPEDGRPFCYGDSSGYVGVAVRNGNAASVLGVGARSTITLVIAEK